MKSSSRGVALRSGYYSRWIRTAAFDIREKPWKLCSFLINHLVHTHKCHLCALKASAAHYTAPTSPAARAILRFSTTPAFSLGTSTNGPQIAVTCPFRSHTALKLSTQLTEPAGASLRRSTAVSVLDPRPPRVASRSPQVAATGARRRRLLSTTHGRRRKLPLRRRPRPAARPSAPSWHMRRHSSPPPLEANALRLWSRAASQVASTHTDALSSLPACSKPASRRADLRVLATHYATLRLRVGRSGPVSRCRSRVGGCEAAGAAGTGIWRIGEPALARRVAVSSKHATLASVGERGGRRHFA